MPQDVPPPAPQPAPRSETDGASIADNVQGAMWAVGEIGASLSGAGPTGSDLGRPKTWYGKIGQWIWVMVGFVIGLAAIAVFLLAAAAWVADWFS